MSDATRRPILSLKNPPAPKPPPEPERQPRLGSPRYQKPPRSRPAPAPPPVVHPWKCRPCGTGFTPSPDLPDDESVRCPSCNAKLGRAAEFRADPPNLEKLRARPAKAAAAKG